MIRQKIKSIVASSARLIASRLRSVLLMGRNLLTEFRISYMRWLGMHIQPNCHISLRAKLDFTNPQGVYIGEGTCIVFGAVILSHDMSRLLMVDTFVGRNCFIGANAIIMPGVRIGDSCIIGSGAVVTRDIPSNCIAVGNPAVVVRSNIKTKKWGILVEQVNST